MSLVMDVCETIHVLDYGRTIAVRPRPESVRSDPAVVEAYLGTPDGVVCSRSPGDGAVPGG